MQEEMVKEEYRRKMERGKEEWGMKGGERDGRKKVSDRTERKDSRYGWRQSNGKIIQRKLRTYEMTVYFLGLTRKEKHLDFVRFALLSVNQIYMTEKDEVLRSV